MKSCGKVINECNSGVILYLCQSKKLGTCIISESRTCQCRHYLRILLNGKITQTHYNYTPMKSVNTKNTNSDVPLLFLLLCFKQHMITTTSVAPTAAMTPIVMMTETEIQQYKLVTFIACMELIPIIAV